MDQNRNWDCLARDTDRLDIETCEDSLLHPRSLATSRNEAQGPRWGPQNGSILRDGEETYKDIHRLGYLKRVPWYGWYEGGQIAQCGEGISEGEGIVNLISLSPSWRTVGTQS